MIIFLLIIAIVTSAYLLGIFKLVADPTPQSDYNPHEITVIIAMGMGGTTKEPISEQHPDGNKNFKSGASNDQIADAILAYLKDHKSQTEEYPHILAQATVWKSLMDKTKKNPDLRDSIILLPHDESYRTTCDSFHDALDLLTNELNVSEGNTILFSHSHMSHRLKTHGKSVFKSPWSVIIPDLNVTAYPESHENDQWQASSKFNFFIWNTAANIILFRGDCR